MFITTRTSRNTAVSFGPFTMIMMVMFVGPVWAVLWLSWWELKIMYLGVRALVRFIESKWAARVAAREESTA